MGRRMNWGKIADQTRMSKMGTEDVKGEQMLSKGRRKPSVPPVPPTDLLEAYRTAHGKIRFGEMRGAIVCGGRSYGEERDAANKPKPGWDRDRRRVYAVLDRAVSVFGIEFIVQGGARGADRFARQWAADRGFPCGTFYARWDTLGLAAGPLRNDEMLAASKPAYVIAFPGGAGTADMMRKAREAGVNVYEIP